MLTRHYQLVNMSGGRGPLGEAAGREDEEAQNARRRVGWNRGRGDRAVRGGWRSGEAHRARPAGRGARRRGRLRRGGVSAVGGAGPAAGGGGGGRRGAG